MRMTSETTLPASCSPAPESSPLNARDFRDGMARMGGAVHLVTSDGPQGWAGFAASAVCSVTDDPPTLLVCLRRDSSAHAAVTGNGVLCVNTLEADHQALSALFGGKTPMDTRRAAADWAQLATGAPVLADARVAFDCRIAHSLGMGTHDVLFCEVLAVAHGASAQGGLYYTERQYRRLAPLPA
ncbi:FMN reductase (NADH) RutF [Pseudorhodoferax aquiterrae]|uniref:FMN reductase (NADH) RutF n=1 Tax=Pseudorhodoferax aquiterrae TaxID=747304 RepID=A0ABQ3G343_9BURK|nr:flavin reductase [Pseudorhodoferax aquiterrae]GHC82671.1 FMN reductase (NADH) RutF [Pseudorhodoferax aquiterrae]